MATTLPKEYKVEKGIPVVRTGSRHFDETIPEYVTMTTKMKVGDSFEFPRDRVNFLHNSRVHLKKKNSPLCFAFTTPETFRKNPKQLTGRCWRIKDGSFINRGPKKERKKGAAIDLSEK